MSNLVAKTNFKYGHSNGDIIEIAHGESVDELPQEYIDEMVAAGLIGPGEIATEEVPAKQEPDEDDEDDEVKE